MAAKFEIFKDKSGDFRWRLVHSNGQSLPYQRATGQG